MTKVASCPTLETSDLLDFKHVCNIHSDKLEVRKLPKGPTVYLPKQFYVDADFAWSAGFYCAEGSKFKQGIGISNCNISLLERFRRNVTDIFNFDYSAWRAIVRTSRKETEAVAENYRGLLATNNILVYFTKLASNDNIELRFNNIVLTSVFHNLIHKSLEYMLADRALALEFLKGYEAGDGSINLRNGCLHDINITVKDEGMKNFLKTLFGLLYGIKMNERMTKGVYEISHSSVKTMTELILDGHFSDHEDQWGKLLKAYSRKEYVRSHFRYWDAIQNRFLTVIEVAGKTSRSHWSVRDALNVDVGLGIVRAGTKKSPRGPPRKTFILTSKGKRLIRILRGVIERG